jgi:hypothetical protein
MKKLLFVAVVVFAGLLLACPRKTPQKLDPSASASTSASSSAPWDGKAKAAAIVEGKATLEKHQCTRCHVIDTIAPGSRPLHCTGCHLFLKGLKPTDDQYKALVKKYGEAILVRYQKNIVHLQQVPVLTKIARRVRPDWIATFLTEPFDVRPLLTESMIRHRLSPDEIKSVVRYFAAVADTDDPFAQGFVAPSLPQKPSDERIAAGKKLWIDKGCNTCHTYGNLKTNVTLEMLETAKPASLLAPNLRFARFRTRPDVIVDWILDPQKILPNTAMPSVQMTRAEAETIRDFVLFGEVELGPTPPLPSLTLPPPITRKVTYEEMKERVLVKVCVHCHMNDYEKDKGPGNRGGLGYEGVQFQMRTYETLVAGAIDKKTKERYSVLVPRPGESLSPILLAMLRRRVEGVRDQVPPFADYERPHYVEGSAELPGMPMGLPSMSNEEIALLARWIEEGCPGPNKVTGVKGTNDGYLVPDGPIEKNSGCDLRTPSATRPAWAIETEATHAATSASAHE